MQRCQHPGMCSPHGGCRPDKSEWQSGYDEGRRMGVKTALDEREQLKSENEALRKDAERYRWLREPWQDQRQVRAWTSLEVMDENIDAAMAKESDQ